VGYEAQSGNHTLLLVHSENNHNLISTDSDKFLNTSDTTSGKFGEQDHAIDVVVFKKLDIGAHFGDLEE